MNGSSAIFLTSANVCRPVVAIALLAGSPRTVCTWNLPASVTRSWTCQGIYSLTSGTSPTLKIDMNSSQNGGSFTETGSASIFSTLTGTSTQNTVTSTSSGNIAILTGVTNTQANAQFTTFGTVQSGSTAGTFSITADMGGSGLVSGTVNVGTVCTLY